VVISGKLSRKSNHRLLKQKKGMGEKSGVSLPEGLTDVTAPAHSCLILMLLDNERLGRSAHIDNVLLERLLRVKTIALVENRDNVLAL